MKSLGLDDKDSAVCRECGESKPIREFTRNRERTQAYCRACASNYGRKVAATKRLAALRTVAGGADPACTCCGETTLEFLAIDHADNDGAEHRKTVSGASLVARLARGEDVGVRLQLLCHNCNMSREFYGACPHVAGSRFCTLPALPAPSRVSEVVALRMVDLAREGRSVREISRVTGFSPPTVRRTLSRQVTEQEMQAITARQRNEAVPEEVRARIIQLHAEGWALGAIARETGFSHPTVRNWLRRSAMMR